MLMALIAVAKRRALPVVVLNAQVSAIDFYRAFGFVPDGPRFFEAGIEHQCMRLALA
jgi:predicted GNAT family N-acyltransferase